MEAELRLKFQLQTEKYQQIPYINVLPRQPIDAYKQFQQSKLNAVKKTQKIPFPPIRQLILMYTLENQKIVDLTQSEYLKQKMINPTINQYHKKINKKLDELIKERDRLKQLYQVTINYNDKRNQLVTEQLKRTINQRYDNSELSGALNSIENNKNDRYMKIKRSPSMSNQKGSINNFDPNEIKQKKQIEEQYNNKIIQLFTQQLPILTNKSQKFHAISENVIYFKSFLNQYEKSLVFIMTSKNIVNKQTYSNQRIIQQIFLPKLKSSIAALEQYVQKNIGELFDWRTSIKENSIKCSTQQKLKQIQDLQKTIYQDVYQLFSDVLAVVSQDKRSIQRTEVEVKKKYQQFLPGYYDAQEVELFFKKQSKINDILTNETKRFIEHLNKNHGIMVFYSKSADYIKIIENNKNKNKSYLQSILEKKFYSLETAINFVNKDYGQMYKQVCQGRLRRDGIFRKMEQLDKDINQEDSVILEHLYQNCRRLLNIANEK